MRNHQSKEDEHLAVATLLCILGGGGYELLEQPRYVLQASGKTARIDPLMVKAVKPLLQLGLLAKNGERLELTDEGREAADRHIARRAMPRTERRLIEPNNRQHGDHSSESDVQKGEI